MQLSDDGRVLTLSPARLHDGGRFTCVAFSEAGTAELNITLTVYVPPSIRPAADPGPVVAVRGHPARLACEATGVPAPTVSWFKTDAHGFARVPVGTGPFLDFTDGISTDHEGCYICLAENEAGSQERSVVLNVLAPPTVERTDTAEVSVMAVAGHNASLSCTAAGSPQPDISWLRRGALAGKHEKRLLTSVGKGASTLTILDVEATDAGAYLCVATNGGGVAAVEYRIDVVVPPHVSSTNATAEEVVLAQHPFSLPCDADGDPLPSIAWYHEGLPVPRDSLTTVRAGWLHVSAAKRHHAGHYVCEASNVGGAVRIAYNVTVWERPQIIGPDSPVRLSAVLGESVQLQCSATGTPTPVLSWSNDGRALEAFNATESVTLEVVREEDAGIYACTAANQAGVTTREMVLTVLGTLVAETTAAVVRVQNQNLLF
ncbi:hypothetical protein V5799_030217 [Amblyomma americanum]|uniref:Ig-like domain-containing protein n=1 Tax=Amblyomma americanum TaxID=6943 RepID=A0AAQ4ENS3_AMBAM